MGRRVALLAYRLADEIAEDLAEIFSYWRNKHADCGDALVDRHDLHRSMIVEGDLPIEKLAQLAVRESRRPRAVYQTHKWFARRFGSAFRGLLTACTVSPDEDFWAAYLGGASLAGKVIADPFVGGGTAVGEAQRLGATCLASDVDPVAVSITRFQSQLADVPALDRVVEDLCASVGAELSRYHMTKDGSGADRTVLHHFFVQTIVCRACGAPGDAHPHYQLAFDKTKQFVFCKACDRVHEIGLRDTEFQCEACGTVTVVAHGTSTYGLYRCEACGIAERLIDVAARTGLPPSFRPFAIEYLGDSGRKRAVPMSERFFKAASPDDSASYASASARLQQQPGLGSGLPRRLIPTKGRVDDRLLRYGYRTYLDLFNDRQLLHLALLKTAIEAQEPQYRQALAIAFCDHLKTNCMLTSYAFGWRRLAPLFSIRAFRHVSRPVEINPWLSGTGRGTYPNALTRIQRAQAWVRDPREPTPSGGALLLGSRPVVGTVEAVVASAHRLGHIDDASVDLVITDPPYFDNIAYSELSDFFLPWHTSFGLVESRAKGFPRDRLRATRGDDASTEAFAARLALSFAEIARVLKRKGLLIFTFQHKTPAGWYALGKALSEAKLRAVRVFPMLGDTDAGPHKHADSIRWDAVIVAVPSSKAADTTAISAAACDWAHATSSDWITRLSANKAFPFHEADAINLRRACLAVASSHALNLGRAKRAFQLYDLLIAKGRIGEGVGAAAVEEGAFAVRPDAVQPPAAPQSFA